MFLQASPALLTCARAVQVNQHPSPSWRVLHPGSGGLRVTVGFSGIRISFGPSGPEARRGEDGAWTNFTADSRF